MILSEEIVITHTHCCPLTQFLFEFFLSFFSFSNFLCFTTQTFSQFSFFFLLYKQNNFTSIFLLHLEITFYNFFIFHVFFLFYSSLFVCVCLCVGKIKKIFFYNTITYTYAHPHMNISIYFYCCCILFCFSLRENEWKIWQIIFPFSHHLFFVFFFCLADTPGFSGVFTISLNGCFLELPNTALHWANFTLYLTFPIKSTKYYKSFSVTPFASYEFPTE